MYGVSENYLVARKNTKMAEDTSTLETESEDLGPSKRRRRIQPSACSDDESPVKRSKHTAPPAFKKSLAEKIKEKLSDSSSIKKPSRESPKKKLPDEADSLESQNSPRKSPKKILSGEHISGGEP